jgi:cell division protein FtsA
MIEVPSVGGREPRAMGRQILSEILEPRVEEIFQLVHHEVERNGFSELLTSGVVITGGSTLLPGMTELAEEIMGVPVRRGVPRGIGGLVDVVKSPVYATGVGLVVYGARHQDRSMFRIREENVFKKVKRRMGEWLQEVF